MTANVDGLVCKKSARCMFKATLSPERFSLPPKPGKSALRTRLCSKERSGGIHQLRLPAVKFLEVQHHPAYRKAQRTQPQGY